MFTGVGVAAEGRGTETWKARHVRDDQGALMPPTILPNSKREEGEDREEEKSREDDGREERRKRGRSKGRSEGKVGEKRGQERDGEREKWEGWMSRARKLLMLHLTTGERKSQTLKVSHYRREL